MKNKKAKPYREPIYSKIPVYIISALLALSALIAFPVSFSPTELTGAYINGTLTDACVACKEIILFAVAALLIVWFACERYFPNHPPKSPLAARTYRLPLILTGGYLLWVLLSTLVSPYREVGFLGFPAVLEGFAAVLGYATLFLGGINWFSGKTGREYFPWLMTASLALNAFLMSIELTFKPLSQIFFGMTDERTGLTLLYGNSSVCGEVLTLMFLPGLALAFDEKTAWKRVLRGALAGTALLGVVCSYSSAAFFTLAACLLLMTVFALAAKKASPARVGTALLSCLIPLAVFAAVQPARTAGYFRAELNNSGVYSAEDSFGIEEISADGNKLTIRGEKSTLALTVSGGELSFFDGNGAALNAITDGDTTTFMDSGYESVSIQRQDGLLHIGLGYDDPITFDLTADIFWYVDQAGYITPITPTAFPELSDYFSAGTGRGYVWLQTLPLLKDRLIFGAGAGGFPFIYPQNDVAGMLRTHGTIILTPKPHCMYLQMFTEYGLPALLIFAALAAIILVRGVKGALRSGGTVCAALALCWLAWLVMGVVNDSAVPYSMWAWALAGVMLALSTKKEEADS